MIETIFERFSEFNTSVMLSAEASTHGEILRDKIRYEQYCSISEGLPHSELSADRQIEVSTTWEGILDADVNNFQHNVVTALIGRCVCKLDGCSDEVADTVELLSLVHDLPEAISGDLTYDDAQKLGIDGHRNDNRALGQMLIEEDFPTITPEIAAKIEDYLNDSKQKQPETEVGQEFEITERIGYVRTALIAQDVVNSRSINLIDKDQVHRLDWLTENVLSNQIPRLIELASSFESARWFLEVCEERISEAIFRLNDDKTRSERISPYYEARGDDVKSREYKWDDFIAAWINYDMQINSDMVPA